MEEDEYRQTYKTLTRVPCAFEKALTNKKAVCDFSRHFCLAQREGYACKSSSRAQICQYLLVSLREKARFSLKIQQTQNPLPHNMEIRVQAGGLQGLLATQGKIPADALTDSIHDVVARALQQYGSIEALPYGEIIQSITQFKGRKRRQR